MLIEDAAHFTGRSFSKMNSNSKQQGLQKHRRKPFATIIRPGDSMPDLYKICRSVQQPMERVPASTTAIHQGRAETQTRWLYMSTHCRRWYYVPQGNDWT